MSRIPDNLIVFFHDRSTMPEVFQDCVNESLAANPEFNLIFLDDNDVKQLIERHFPQFQSIYSRVRIPAARADIARLIALYQFGGVYTDISMAFRTSFRSLFKDEDALFLVRRDDFYPHTDNPDIPHLINGIIGAAPESEFILECLKRIFFNLSQRYINYSVNIATGPIVITETFFAKRAEFPFPFTVENFSTLMRMHFVYRRVSGINNSWRDVQNKGIMKEDGSETESPQDRAWREFSQAGESGCRTHS